MTIKLTKDSVIYSVYGLGVISGYSSGGFSQPVYLNVIDKFPFSTDANASDVGDLTQARFGPAGQSSAESGYTSGGGNPSRFNTIDKFPFTTDANASDVGDLTQIIYGVAGQSSAESGYTSGGSLQTTPVIISNTVDKFPFTTDANATDVGDLTAARDFGTGQSSTSHGYSSGGRNPAPPAVFYDIIDKFPFSTDANATDVGDLTQARYGAAGQSSISHGYTSGGFAPPSPTYVDTIDKFPFATDSNASDVGNLTKVIFTIVGQSSSTSGYNSGGFEPVAGYVNTIDKFPFAADANATDVGDLSVTKGYAAGQQV